jgi:hypothetical protein
MNLASIKEAFGLTKDFKSVLADWKDRNFTALGGAIGVLIVAAVHFARSFGYALPFDIDQDTANRIGIGVAALCSLLHVGAPAAGNAAGVDAAAVARPTGDRDARGIASPAAPVGGVAAVTRAPDPVRDRFPKADGPGADVMP